MATIAIGDIHGNLAALFDLLGQLRHEVGGEDVVVFHWNNAELDADGWPRPKIVGNTIGIDTISHGVLTAIRMPDRQVFQSARHAQSKKYV